VLDEAVEFGGQIVYVDGQEVNRGASSSPATPPTSTRRRARRA